MHPLSSFEGNRISIVAFFCFFDDSVTVKAARFFKFFKDCLLLRNGGDDFFEPLIGIHESRPLYLRFISFLYSLKKSDNVDDFFCCPMMTQGIVVIHFLQHLSLCPFSSDVFGLFNHAADQFPHRGDIFNHTSDLSRPAKTALLISVVDEPLIGSAANIVL